MTIQRDQRHLGAFIIPILCLLMSCATTAFKSQVAGEVPQRQYSRILVISMLDNIDLQTAMETKAVASLADRGVEGVPACSLFIPDYIYAPREFDSVVAASNADAMLCISPVIFGGETSALPGLYGIKFDTQEPARQGEQFNPPGTFVYTTSLPRQYKQGGFLKAEWMTFEAELIDVDSRKAVWTGTARSSGDAFVGFKSIVKSMGGRTVSILHKDGLLNCPPVSSLSRTGSPYRLK